MVSFIAHVAAALSDTVNEDLSAMLYRQDASESDDCEPTRTRETDFVPAEAKSTPMLFISALTSSIFTPTQRGSCCHASLKVLPFSDEELAFPFGHQVQFA